jgi:uncharacterized membrane protein (DUF4010 family)
MPSGALLEILAAVGTALIAGFLVGAQRQHHERERFAGARTFPLFALAGALGALLGPWVLVALALGVGALIAIAYKRETTARSDVGMSTEMAAVVTFGLGALCTAEQVMSDLPSRLLLVGAIATAMLALLSFKRPLHGFIARLSEEDVFATVKLLLLAVILVPVLPSVDVGPWEAINPRQVGLLVLLISAVGFVGYAAVRLLGPRRGLGLTGVLGGLASSTAVTLSLSGRVKDAPALTGALAAAIVMASSVLFVRLVLVLSAVAPELGRAVAPSLAAATVAGMAVGGALYLRAPRGHEQHPDLLLGNPLSLAEAFKFAALFLVVLTASRAASHYLGDHGAYLAATVAGLADADSPALSFARLQQRDMLRLAVARDAVLLAAAANTVAKVALAAVIGGRGLALRVGPALAAALAAGAAVAFLA